MKGGINNLSALMKQAQKVQENLMKAQEELATLEVEGQSGAGAVKVVMTGKHEVKRVTIDADSMDDKEMLEDLIAAAVNDATRRVESVSKERMDALTGGMGLPPGLNMLG